MAEFQPPPTYAEPVLIDEKTGKPRFNPIWLKWFLDMIAIINAAGGGSGSIQHNDTSSLQGGTTNEFYHLTAAQQALAVLIFVAGLRPPTPAGGAQVVTKLSAGSGVPANGDGADGDFYFRSDGVAGANTTIYHKQAGTWVGLTA